MGFVVALGRASIAKLNKICLCACVGVSGSGRSEGSKKELDHDTPERWRFQRLTYISEAHYKLYVVLHITEAKRH